MNEVSSESGSGIVPSWQFYRNCPEAWMAMLQACRQATTSIVCEQYIFEEDAIGLQFAEIFIAKAQDGIKVRLLFDGAGSYDFVGSLLEARLREAGIELLFFNPIKAWRVHHATSLFLRDHRKILVVDAMIGFTGGMGIASRMTSWRDTNVKVEGDLAQKMADSFEVMWKITSVHRFMRFEKNAGRKSFFEVVSNSPRLRQRYIYHALLKSIKIAKKYIYISTPYFIPSFRLNHALLRAARRGVDVRIMVPASADIGITQIASRSYFSALLRAGVRIFQYKGPMFHVKTLVADDEWSTIGSANMDNLSLLFNHEMNIVSSHIEFSKEIKEHFSEDTAKCEELFYDTWHNRSFFLKVQEFFVRPLHGML